MTEEKLISPQWLMEARKNRKKFILRVIVLFAICSVLAFWALPRLTSMAHEVIRAAGGGGGGLPVHVKTLLWLASWFRVLWVGIAIGCGVALLLATTGKIDTLLPLFNILLLVAALAAVGFTLYVYHVPALSLMEGIQ